MSGLACVRGTGVQRFAGLEVEGLWVGGSLRALEIWFTGVSA